MFDCSVQCSPIRVAECHTGLKVSGVRSGAISLDESLQAQQKHVRNLRTLDPAPRKNNTYMRALHGKVPSTSMMHPEDIMRQCLLLQLAWTGNIMGI
eukprot:5123429-Amphidinium_carterae.2